MFVSVIIRITKKTIINNSKINILFKQSLKDDIKFHGFFAEIYLSYEDFQDFVKKHG